MPRQLRLSILCSVFVTAAVTLSAQQMNPTPSRQAGDGEGPFDRLVIRGVTVIDGTGAPPRGPMDVVVQNNRITDVASVGFPGVPINEKSRPAKGAQRDRRHRHVFDAGLRGRARALWRRPGARSRIRLQAVDDARRHDRPRRAVRIDGLGPQPARAVGEEPDRRAADLLVSPPVQRRGLGPGEAARRRRPLASGSALPRRRASTASSSAPTIRRSWRRCSTRPRRSISARRRTSIRWASRA